MAIPVNTIQSRRQRAQELPPELWLEVFSYASTIPGAYTHTDPHAFIAFTLDTHGISVHRRHRDATDTMLAVSRVCRRWTPLATDFLFKYILVRSGAHAIQIACALKPRMTGGRTCASSGRAWGSGTVRLELALEGVHVWEEAHTVALGRILDACPNLAVFSTAFSTSTGFRQVESGPLCRAMGLVGRKSSIRRLELSGSTPEMEGLICTLSPHIEALWILPGSARTSGHMGGTPVTLPALHVLVTAEAPSQDWTTPALRSLILDRSSDAASPCDRTQAFLSEQGRQLEQFSAGSNTGHALRLGLRLCPNLTDCSLSLAALLDLDSLGHPMSLSLRRLTLSHALGQSGLAGFEWGAIANLNGWLRKGWDTGYLPSLTTIRFRLPVRRCKRLVPGWTGVMQALEKDCSRYGVRLEVSLGADEHTADIWRPLSMGHSLCAFRSHETPHAATREP